MKPTVILCNIPDAKRSAIAGLCVRLGLKVLPVAPESFSLPLERLLEGEVGSGSAEAFTDELLVLAEVPEMLLNFFLQGLRRQRTPVALKAMLTPTNRSWSLAQLHAELCREREAIEQQRQAHKQ